MTERQSHPSLKIARTRAARLGWIGAGWISVGLGVIGVFLPVMPTAPFMILAAFCFSKGSEKLYGWITSHKAWGKGIRNWNEHRVIPTRAKILALSMMAVGGTISFLNIPDEKAYLRYISIGVMSFGAIFVLLQKSNVQRK